MNFTLFNPFFIWIDKLSIIKKHKLVISVGKHFERCLHGKWYSLNKLALNLKMIDDGET